MIMKKYKHKKTGFIAELASHGNDYNVVLDGEIQGTFPKWAVENSNDWEEVKSEYPKILEFSDGFNKYYKKSDDGKFTINLQYDYSEHDLLKRTDLNITKIQTSENDIWTIGDEVKYKGECHYKPFKIDNFFYNEKEGVFLARSTSFSLGEDVMEIIKTKHFLFRTEDGVDIFKGDTYYYCPSLKNLPHWDDPLIKLAVANSSNDCENKNFVFFGTKEAAEKYSDENKPRMFSKKQILNVITHWETFTQKPQGKLSQFIKENLNL